MCSFQKFRFGISRKHHTGVLPQKEAAEIKAKSQECSGVGQAEVVSLWEELLAADSALALW